MEESISVKELLRVIKRLPSDEPVYHRPDIWYTTQKQHWISWLSHYDGPGAYGRIPGQNRNARFAYNHVVCPDLLLYLIKAINIEPDLIAAAEEAYQNGDTLMEKSGRIRKIVPWSKVYETIWGNKKPTFFERVFHRSQRNKKSSD